MRIIPLIIFLSLPVLMTAQNGVVRTYFDDGTIESEISYVNDILDGYSYFYFPNGNMREEIPFSYGKVHGTHRKFYGNGLVKEEKEVRDGILEGLAKVYYENGALKEFLNYENGKLIKKTNVPYDSNYTPPLESYLAGNRQYKLSKDSQIVSSSAVSPVPLFGLDEIQKNITYSDALKNKTIKGSATISAEIDTNGIAANVSVVKSFDSEFDMEAVKAVKQTRFLPGKDNGRPVNSKIMINVEFKPPMEKFAAVQMPADSKKEMEQIVKPAERKIEIQEKTVDMLKEIQNKESLKSDSIKNSALKEETVPKEVKDNQNISSIEEARPNGGIERIIARMVIPESAVKNQTAGDIVVKIEVDKYGVVRDIEFLKGLGDDINKAVENAINNTPFIAGKINGEKIKSYITITIPFSYKK